MNNVTVKMFGAFRKYIPEGQLEVQIPTGASVPEAKRLIAAEIRKRSPSFAEDSLIRDSALGDAEGVYTEDQNLSHLSKKSILAFLPPVCGG